MPATVKIFHMHNNIIKLLKKFLKKLIPLFFEVEVSLDYSLN